MQLSSKAEFELIPRSELHSFAVREFHLPSFQSPWHFHPEIELTYIVQSQGKRFVGDHIAPFGPGDLVLLGANLPHYWHNPAPARGIDRWARSVVIQFREDCLGAEFFTRPELAGVQALLQRAGRGLHFTGSARDAVADLMLAMAGRDGLSRLIDFLSILQRLAGAGGSPLSSAGFVPWLDERAGERINRAYQHVFTHFASPLDYAAIAQQAGMSLSAFSHYFKRVTGRTLSDFVREVRLGHARKLLIESQASIAEIAYASGFESLSNFNRCFRLTTGSSPREFRMQHRGS
jgi:AraC-like DNA-binding protein